MAVGIGRPPGVHPDRGSRSGKLCRITRNLLPKARFLSTKRSLKQSAIVGTPQPNEPSDDDAVFFRQWITQEEGATPLRRGVIYARYSTDAQDTSESIEVQISSCRKYAIEHGIVINREAFVDRAETGTSTQNRQAYQQLLTVAQSSECDFEVILTFHTSRWGRGMESEIDEYKLGNHGIKIIAVSQPFTGDEGVESAFMKGVLRKIDAYYSMQASKYTHAYQTSNAFNGFKNGGSAPDGYAIEQVPTGKRDKYGVEKMKAKLILDVKPGQFDLTDRPRHKLIEFAFANALQGRGIKWLSKAVYHEGWRSRYRPEPISKATIRTWLMNPLYTGYMVWNRVRFFRRNGRRTYIPNPVSKWVCSPKPAHPAIISKEVFERVAAKFLRHDGRVSGAAQSRPQLRNPELDNRGHFLLSGLLCCSTCGSNYVAAKSSHSGKKTHVYYVCNTKWRRGKNGCTNPNINLAVAEGATLDALFNAVLTEGEIRKFVDAFNLFAGNQAQRSKEEFARIEAEEACVRVEMDRIKRAIISGADPRPLAIELNERQKRLDKLQSERSILAGTTSKDAVTYDPSRFTVWAQMLKNNFLSMDFETRRELVRRFVATIDVRPDRTAEMTWNPDAILQLADGARVPATAIMVMKELCGGMKQIDRQYPRPKILLKFEVKGKSRWPFGWEILRELEHMRVYPIAPAGR